MAKRSIFVVLATVASLAAVARGDESAALDLEGLVREARGKHPETETARRAAAALHEVPSRVGALPDPVVVTSVSNLRLDDLGLGAHPMTGLVVGISQRVPFPGKLDRRERSAEAAARVGDDRISVVQEDVELRVRLLYWRLHYAERAEAIVAENERVLDTLTNVVHARFSVGHGAQQDALQAQVAHSRLRARLAERREAVVSARRALNSAVGRDPTAQLATTAAPGALAPLRSREELLAAARRHNPVLAMRSSSIEVSRRRLAEARRDRLPDLSFGLGYRARAAAAGDMSDGADMVSVSVGISLPIWIGRKQDARVRQQHHVVEREKSAFDAVELAVATGIARAVDALDRLDEELGLYVKELLPQSDQALDASIADYQVGKVGFVSVLSNWRTVLQVRLDHERLIVERAQRRAELRALVGASITEGDR